MPVVRLSFSGLFVWLGLLILSAKIGLSYNDQTYTLQTVVVLLMGAITGSFRAFMGVCIYLFLGKFFPVFNGPDYGTTVYSGYTTGYLLAFPFASLLAAKFNQAEWYWNCLVFFLIHLFILVVGVLWLFQEKQLSFSAAWRFGFQAYLGFALIKALLCSLLLYLYVYYENQKIQSATN